MRKRKRHILPVILAVLVCILLGILGWNWYDSHVDRSGWTEKGGVTYYRDFHARRVTG